MLLLKQDMTRKRQVVKNDATELNASNNKSKKYEVEAIWDSAIYARKVNGLSIKALLSGFLKKLSKRKKYLRALFISLTP